MKKTKRALNDLTIGFFIGFVACEVLFVVLIDFVILPSMLH